MNKSLSPHHWGVWINSLWITFLGMFVNYFAGVYLARLLKPEFYGYFNSLDSLLTILAYPFSAASIYVLVRLIPKYFKTGDFSEIKGLIYYTSKLSVKLLVVFYLLWVIGYLGKVEFHFRFDDLTSHPMFWGVLILPTYVISAFCVGFLIAKQYSNLTNWTSQVLYNLFCIVSFFILHLYINSSSLKLVLFGTTLTNLVFDFFLVASVFYISSKSLWKSSPTYNKKLWSNECRELVSYSVMKSIINNCPLVIMSTYPAVFSAQDISIYGMLLVVFSTISVQLTVDISTVMVQFISDSKQKNQYILDRSIRLNFWISIVLAIGALIFKDKILLSFGKHYYDNASQFYTASVILSVVAIPFSYYSKFLSYTPWAANLVKVLPAFTIGIILLSYLSIYLFGIWGGMVIFVLVSIPFQAYAAYLIKFKLGMKLTNFLKIY